MTSSMIIGCGRIAGLFDTDTSLPIYSHARAMHQLGIDIKCFVDDDINKAIELSLIYPESDVSSNIIEALEKYKPDIAVISTPDGTHARIAQCILESDFSPTVLFIEKPVCKTEGEFDLLKSAAEQSNTRIVVHQNRRFDRRHRLIRDLIANGEFGTTYKVNVTYYGGWEHNGVHVVDLLHFFFNGQYEQISINDAVVNQYPNDPTLSVTMRNSDSGFVVVFDAINEDQYQIYDVDMKFENGRLQINDFGNEFRYWQKFTNSKGENVLNESDLDLPEWSSSIVEAYDKILKFIKTGNNNLIEDTSLTAIKPTMETLWRVRREYAN